MQTPESEVIVQRFFSTLKEMKHRGYIRGKQTFTTRYGINRWNLNTLEKEPHRDIFQPAWLEYLVRDYGVSAHWLLTYRKNGNALPPPGTQKLKPERQSPRSSRPRSRSAGPPWLPTRRKLPLAGPKRPCKQRKMPREPSSKMSREAKRS